MFQSPWPVRRKDDLDKLILRLTEESFRPLMKSRSDGYQTLLDVSLARIHRFKKLGQLKDANPIIEYLRSLREYSLEAYHVPHHAVTTSLVEMLSAREKATLAMHLRI